MYRLYDLKFVRRLIALIAVMVFFSFDTLKTSLIYAGVILLIFLIIIYYGKRFEERGHSRTDIILVFIIDVILSYRFYYIWRHSSKIKLLADSFSLSVPIVFVGITILLSFLSSTYLFDLFNLLRIEECEIPDYHLGNLDYYTFLPYVICVLTAIIVITICSKCSPLYPLCDWSDSHCYFTVGKAISNGMVLYRDIFEQKGPLIYFLNVIAYGISDRTLVGVYLYEIIACSFFLYYCYKTLRLFFDENVLFVIPIMASVMYTSVAFRHGNSVEEICLPFLAYGLYVSVKSLHTDQPMSTKELLLIGITSGCVFWTKYTLVGFYIGWIIIPFLAALFEREWRYIGKIIGFILLGVFISTIPYLIYFGFNHAIKDCFEVYFYDNMFLYTQSDTGTLSSGIIGNLIKGFRNMYITNIHVLVLTFIGLIWCYLKSHLKILLHMSCMIATSFFFVFFGGRAYLYYSFILDMHCLFGFASLFDLIKELIDYKKLNVLITSNIIMFLLLYLGCFYFTPNRYLMKVNKEEMPQYKFEKIIRTVDDPTLLNYGFLDGGYYTVSGIVPNCKFFCKLNIPFKEMDDVQDEYVMKGKCDFVVTNKEYSFEKYELVTFASHENEDYESTYYLYKLKENKEE